MAIISWPWGAYLGEEGQANGIRAKISSWQRVGPNVIPHTAKATGLYLNSMLAVNEALDAGYDEAILLTSDGLVADGSGENMADEVFMCGTAAEVTPLRSIDGVELGVGSVTEALRDEYLRCVRGTSVYAPAWLEHVTLELAA